MRRARGARRVLRARAAAAAAFEPLRSATARSSRATPRMKAGKAEEALGHYDKAVAKLPADAGRALRSRRRALRAVALRRGGAGVPARDRGQGRRAQGVGLLQPGQRLLQEGEVQGGGRGLQAHARRSSRDDERAKWNLEIALQASRRTRRRSSRTRRTRTTRTRTRRRTTRRRTTSKTRTRTKRRTRTKTRTRRTSKTRTRTRSQKDKQNQEQPKPAAEHAGRAADPAGARQPGAQLQGPREGARQGAGGAARAAGA